MHLYEMGFAVREPSWHQLEDLIMKELALPEDREEAVKLAGHDFEIVEVPCGNLGRSIDDLSQATGNIARVDGQWRTLDVRDDKKGLYINHRRMDDFGPLHGKYVETVNMSLTTLQNSIGWDVLEAIVGEGGAKLDTGMVLKGGAICLVTAFLDEPAQVEGDDSLTLPFIVVRWTHDGTGALCARYTSVRVVCANTDELSAAEARKTGREYTFRHTKNVMERIEDAKMALKGIRAEHDTYMELANELASIPVTVEQRELFVTSFLPMPPEALISDRVMNNVENARSSVRALFNGKTIPPKHELTAYGLRLAGIEYLDHIRGYRNHDTYVGRQLLKTEPAKVKLTSLIKEVIAA